MYKNQIKYTFKLKLDAPLRRYETSEAYNYIKSMRKKHGIPAPLI